MFWKAYQGSRFEGNLWSISVALMSEFDTAKTAGLGLIAFDSPYPKMCQLNLQWQKGGGKDSDYRVWARTCTSDIQSSLLVGWLYIS